MTTPFTSRLLAAAAMAVGVAACSDATTPAPAASNRQIGVLQLEIAGVPMIASAEASVPAAPPGADLPPRGGGPRPTGPDSAVTSGPISWDRPPGAGTVTAAQVIQVADTVQVGQPVPIVVYTVLPDGCWRTDGEDVRQNGLTVDITPQDARSDADICTMIYGYGAHRASVTFATRGTAKIRVTGRRVRQGDESRTEPVTAERTVVVR